MVSSITLLEGHYRTACPTCGTWLDYTAEDIFIRIYQDNEGKQFWTDAIKCCVCPTHVLLKPPQNKGED